MLVHHGIQPTATFKNISDSTGGRIKYFVRIQLRRGVDILSVVDAFLVTLQIEKSVIDIDFDPFKPFEIHNEFVHLVYDVKNHEFVVGSVDAERLQKCITANFLEERRHQKLHPSNKDFKLTSVYQVESRNQGAMINLEPFGSPPQPYPFTSRPPPPGDQTVYVCDNLCYCWKCLECKDYLDSDVIIGPKRPPHCCYPDIKGHVRRIIVSSEEFDPQKDHDETQKRQDKKLGRAIEKVRKLPKGVVEIQRPSINVSGQICWYRAIPVSTKKGGKNQQNSSVHGYTVVIDDTVENIKYVERGVKERPATHFLPGDHVYTTDMRSLSESKHSVLLSYISDSKEEGDWNVHHLDTKETKVINEKYFHRRVPVDDTGGQIHEALEIWFFKCSCAVHGGVNYHDGKDVISCDSCRNWMHIQCVLPHLPPGTNTDDLQFICSLCKQRIREGDERVEMAKEDKESE
jgi:hypothetical protein